MAFLEYRPTTSLFHYCGSDGFYGITENGSVWLSDLQYSNDPKELQLVAVIETLMLELIRDPKTPADLRATYKSLVPRIQTYRPNLALNSFSLSLKGDQLPMWQEYTDRGRGFCIAFRATAFNDMPLRVQKVQYVSPDYFGLLHGQVEAIVRPLVGSDPNQIEQIINASQLFALATSVKDETWRHEEEVRLIFSSSARPGDFDPGKPLPISLLQDGTPVFPENALYRERLGQKVPYHVKPFGRLRERKWDASGAIERVIIGPNNTCLITEVRDYLLGLGYRNFEVIQSRCAFR